MIARTVTRMADAPDFPRHIGVVVDVLGYGDVTLDGVDLDAVQAVSVDIRPGQPTRVLLEMKPAAVTFDGMAVVEQTVSVDMLEQLCRLLAAVDPVTLEQRALAVEDLTGDAPVTRSILRELALMIRGE